MLSTTAMSQPLGLGLAFLCCAMASMRRAFLGTRPSLTCGGGSRGGALPPLLPEAGLHRHNPTTVNSTHLDCVCAKPTAVLSESTLTVAPVLFKRPSASCHLLVLILVRSRSGRAHATSWQVIGHALAHKPTHITACSCSMPAG